MEERKMAEKDSERERKRGGKFKVMKTLFENYCMYLPNTGHCMLRKNTRQFLEL